MTAGDDPSREFAQALPPGSFIGSLEVVRELGRGAFAITYLAQNSLGQQLAVKEFFPGGMGLVRQPEGSIFAASGSNQDAFLRWGEDFHNEAHIIAGLSHPNVVEVRDFIKINNTYYFVMPFYPGRPMDQVLQQDGPLPPDKAHAYFQGLLGALEYIHSQPQPVYHRDIKPANIYLNSSTDTPILIDFGAAKKALSENTELASKLIGTDHYRAREQLSEQGQIGPWTDIYGLSATFYRLVSGQLPTDIQTRVDAAFEEQIDPLEPLVADPVRVERYGRSFLHAIDMGLNLRRQDRPQNVAEWRSLLARPDDSSAPSPVNPPHNAPGFTPRFSDSHENRSKDSLRRDDRFKEDESSNWGRYAIVGIVLLAILGGGGYAATRIGAGSATQSNEPPDVKPVQVKKTEGEAWLDAFNAGTASAFQDYLSQFPDGENAPKARVELAKLDAEAWSEAQSRNSVAGYDDYLTGFPDGENAAEARKRRDNIQKQQQLAAERAQQLARQEAGDWATAAQQDTIDSYTSYLSKHPSGANASSARSRLDQLRVQQKEQRDWAAAKAQNTARAYEIYLAAHPAGMHVAEAMQKIEELKPKPGRTFIDCSGCPEMMILPTGTFTQGSDDAAAKPNEKPTRAVSLNYYLAVSVTEITFDQWSACVSAGTCRTTNDKGWGQGNRPVINVTWSDAQKYVSWLNSKTGQRYDLPTESEWEYAARANERGPFPKNNPAALCAFANIANAESGMPWANKTCSDPVGDRTMPVGALLKNDFGLKDMIGNVAEWTSECNTLNYRGAPTDGSKDPRGSCRQNIVRGGSWFSGPNESRFSARTVINSEDSNDFTGFRVVRRFEP